MTGTTAIFRSEVEGQFPISGLAGEEYSVRFALSNNDMPASSEPQILIIFFGGAEGITFQQTALGSLGTIGTGEWKGYEYTFTQDFSDRTVVSIYIRVWSGSIVDGQGVYLDGVTLTKTDHPAPIFDGDSPGAYWTGTPHASTSILVR
jgi:hypothetical protein